MNGVGLVLPAPAYGELWQHLLPRRLRNEQAAFGYVRPDRDGGAAFDMVEWRLIAPQEFVYQGPYHLELRDDVRAGVIKRAHDVGASIVEFHSHIFGGSPGFSWSDMSGFEETVPHCIWRLKGKPYFAVVVSRAGFDGLAWFSRDGAPTQLEWVNGGGRDTESERRKPD